MDVSSESVQIMDMCNVVTTKSRQKPAMVEFCFCETLENESSNTQHTTLPKLNTEPKNDQNMVVAKTGISYSYWCHV